MFPTSPLASRPPVWISLAALALITAAGCTQRMEHQLVGRWEGRPDSLQAYSVRKVNELELNLSGGDPQPPASQDSAATAGDRPAARPALRSAAAGRTRQDTADAGDRGPSRTTLENIDLRISLDLRSDGTAHLSRDGGQEPLHGSWTLLAAAGRKGTLQITVEELPPSSAGATGADSAPVVRQFEIELADDGNGFTLSEVRADPQFGWLYFRRVE